MSSPLHLVFLQLALAKNALRNVQQRARRDESLVSRARVQAIERSKNVVGTLRVIHVSPFVRRFCVMEKGEVRKKRKEEENGKS